VILQRYILRELVVTFVFAFVTLLAVCIIGTVFQVLRSFEGMGLALVWKMIPLAGGWMSPWVLPVASCITATLVYGRLAAENEIDAMRMSGIHVSRILAPAILFGLGLAALGYGINEHVAPWASYSRRAVLRDSIVLALRLPPPGIQRFTIGPYKLSYADYEDGRMERPYLTKYGPRGQRELEYKSKSGRIVLDESGRAPQIVMAQPEVTQYQPLVTPLGTEPEGKVTRISIKDNVSVPLEIEDIYRNEKVAADSSSREELLAHIARIAPKDHDELAKVLTALQTRYAQAGAPLLLVLVAAPIGIFVKRGSRLAGLGAALPPLLLYLGLYLVFQSMGTREKISPALAAWAPDAVMGSIALVLLAGVHRR
jgi:lipopolysaccharide export LptBFGC system permease protein LptF